MKILRSVMWLAPIGILSLVTAKLIKVDDIPVLFVRMGMFVITAATGLFIHGMLVLPFIYFLVTQSNPYRYMRNAQQAILFALGADSSCATLPINLHCAEKVNKIDKRIARLVLPIGATVNMDGLCLYAIIVVLYIAQINAIILSYEQIIMIWLTTVMMSVGVAGVPGAAIPAYIAVLNTVNLPVQGLTSVLALEWIVGRFKTVINVLSDAIGAGVIAHLSRKELDL